MKRLTAALAVVALVAAGCQGSPEKRDAHQTGGDRIDRSPAQWIVAMPDDYPNIAEKCDIYGNLIMAGTHNGGHSTFYWVVPNSPACKGYHPTRRLGH